LEKSHFNLKEGERGLYCDDIVIGEIGDEDE